MGSIPRFPARRTCPRPGVWWQDAPAFGSHILGHLYGEQAGAFLLVRCTQIIDSDRDSHVPRSSWQTAEMSWSRHVRLRISSWTKVSFSSHSQLLENTNRWLVFGVATADDSKQPELVEAESTSTVATAVEQPRP
jgi:hypothetical protein